ncbi:MAG: hypothetical protein EP298_00035 [Gammaproteobacteria bacterium]|nr:MAG: hypothetical protein EP298_00035 [Gammaproteobacteria bacterium]UTW43228.1 hypothetical protein KFE69_03540 [bacterium SCSIO 12844]
MLEGAAKHIIDHLQKLSIEKGIKLLEGVTDRTNKVHFGLGVYNFFNGKARSKSNASNEIIYLNLKKHKLESIKKLDLIKCIVKICKQGTDNNKGSFSHWYVSNGSAFSYNSYNTTFMVHLLLATLYHKKFNDSIEKIKQKLVVISQDTFEDIDNFYKENNDQDKIKFEKNSLFIESKTKIPRMIMFDQKNEKELDESKDLENQ